MNQVEVKILQQSYLLACKEGQESRLTEAVGLVDGAMTRIHDAGKVRARERIAVLAALNLAFELGDLRQAHAQLLEQLPPPSAAASDEAVDKAAFDVEAAAAFSAQSLALEALVARLEAVLNPAVELAEPAVEALVQPAAEAEPPADAAEQAQEEEEEEQPNGTPQTPQVGFI